MQVTSDLDQANQFVEMAQNHVDKNTHPEIWKALNDVWGLIDSQLDYEDEQSAHQDL